MDLIHLRQILNPIVAGGMEATIDRLIRDKDEASPAEMRSFIARERAYRKTTDLAAKHWAKAQEWPIINAEVARYLFLRFNSAVKFLDTIEPIRPQFKSRDSRILTWLLVDNWRHWGHSNWVRTIFGEPFVMSRILA